MLELYEQYKGLLFHLAYQMTGTVSDAEDAVQDVFVKVQSLPGEAGGAKSLSVQNGDESSHRRNQVSSKSKRAVLRPLASGADPGGL